MDPVLLALLASGAAGGMTAVGATPALAGRAPSEGAQNMLLGFAAGVMLSASFFSLILPAVDEARELYGGGPVPALVAAGGVVVGVIAIAACNETAPHRHFISGREGPRNISLERIWLFVIAIAIHNLPEGMAVGVGFGSEDRANAVSVAIGIGLQNAPEGLAVAVALATEGYTRTQAFMVAALTGAIEPIGGVVAAAAVSAAEWLLPWALAFAAGAMLYVISHEIIPETHRGGHQRQATAGLTVGLTVMLILDVWLG